MIEKIVVAPRDAGSISLELHGDLARILALCSENAKAPSRPEMGLMYSLLNLVAGARFELTTFRL